MNDELLDLVEEYVKVFDEIFPSMELKGYTDEELTKLIKQALKDNKPIRNGQDEGVLY